MDQRGDRLLATQTIEELVCDHLSKITAGEFPSFSFPQRVAKNVEFNAEAKKFELIETPKLVHVALNTSLERFGKYWKCLGKSYEALTLDKSFTKRDFFYLGKNLFRNQAQSDRIIEETALILGLPRGALNIHAADRGLVIGDLSFTVKGRKIDCLASPSGIAVPGDISQANQWKCGAKSVIVIEKDATFQNLAAQRIHEKLGCVLITGKGFPGVATRQLVQHLCMELKLPVYVLTDGDPFGFSIFLLYRYGPRLPNYDDTTTPDLIWLGVTLPTDLALLPGEMEALKLPLAPRESKILDNLLEQTQTTPRMFTTAQCEHLKFMKRSGVKVGIQAFDAANPKFLINSYFPTKIASCTPEIHIK